MMRDINLLGSYYDYIPFFMYSEFQKPGNTKLKNNFLNSEA